MEVEETQECSLFLVQTKKCRFFSSNDECPFQKIGCKFKLEDDPSNDIDRAEMNEEHRNETDDSESELILENQCHLCMKQDTSRDDLTKHYRVIHIQIYNLMINRTML
jgi:hypothetical protein